jgi:ribosomal protein S18 acetylase RimI-like enzyme
MNSIANDTRNFERNMTSVQNPEPIAPSENSVQSTFRIRQVTPTDAQGLDIIAALHMELLPFGPMTKFGQRLIRDICYAAPLRKGLVKLAIAEVDGQPAGFIGYSDNSELFYHSLIRGNLLQASWVMMFSLLQRPRRILGVPRALQVMLSRNNLLQEFEKLRQEVIVFAVRPEFLTPAFVRRTGLRVGAQLINHAFDYFRRNGVKQVRMIVDASNRPVLFFYSSLGANFIPCIYGGVPSMLVVVDI